MGPSVSSHLRAVKPLYFYKAPYAGTEAHQGTCYYIMPQAPENKPEPPETRDPLFRKGSKDLEKTLIGGIRYKSLPRNIIREFKSLAFIGLPSVHTKTNEVSFS